MSTSVGVLLALLVGAASAWLLLPPLPGDDVPVPPPDASPAEVVTAFLAALDSPDCDTAEALAGVDVGVDAWCGSVAALEDVRVGEAAPERPEWSGRPDGDEVVHVPVTFDLDWRLLHDDGSLDEGPTTWGYLLARSAPGSPWRIVDQGPA